MRKPAKEASSGKLRITPSDIRWLSEIRNGQIVGGGRKVEVPELDLRKLIQMGFVKQKLGDLVITQKGRDALAQHS